MSDRTRVGVDRFCPKRLGSSLFVSLLLIAGLSRAAYAAEIVDRFPNETWDSVDATQLGWSADLMADAREWSKIIGSSAVMVIQHGIVVAEWGDTQKRMELASVRKSLLSALIGNAVARNQIDLAEPIGMLGIDDNAPSLTPEEKSASVGDLLKARSGVYHPALYETPSMAAQRPARGSHLPGSFWYYNNWDFNALGAIYLQKTGSSVFDALDREIAKPIGMQDYRPADGVYFTGPASVYPAYPIRMSARDLARFALLYLHDGRWKDRQIVPAQWVHDCVKAYSRSDYGPGYGYLWWTDFLDPTSPRTTVRLPEGAFFAWGAAGQYALVIPALDIVVVHRVNRDIPDYKEVNLWQFGRLLWLILSAAHQPDIGPDVSLQATKGQRLDDAALASTLQNATFERLPVRASGMTRVHIDANGHYAFSGGDTASGTWEIKDARYCRMSEPQYDRRCYSVVADGDVLRFYDPLGLPQFEWRKAPVEP
jgi:CubicO group peptidase (beta-lactamase class C family)